MMPTSFRRLGHPLLAAVLSVTINGIAQAEPPERPEAAMSARSGELELLQEEESVSIASRYEQPISESPSNVYVITDEDIRQSGAIDLPTILRRIPGIEVMQMTGADFNVSVRGDNQMLANKMLILVDGRSIYIDASGAVYWKNIPVTLAEIKRIEVLKGPAASVYGFNAFDGVVNIVTKSPMEMRGTTIQFGGGEFGTISSAAIHAGTQGKVGYRLSVGHDQNQQWRNRDSLAFRNNKFNVQTEYALHGDAKLQLSGGLVDANRFDGPITEVTQPAGTPQQGYAYLSYERRDAFIRAWWNSSNDTTRLITYPLLADFLTLTDPNLSRTSYTRLTTYNIEMQHTVDLPAGNRLTYGANYRHNGSSSNILTGFTREDRLGLYLQDDWKVHRTVSLVTGLRYDLDTFINPTWSPRIALIFSPSVDHSFRASGSVAYRPPNAFEHNLDVRNLVTVGPLNTVFNTQGSKNLGPEEIVSYELGYQGWYLKHRLRVRTALFYNQLSDLISFRPSGPVLTDPVLPRNSGKADIYGGEAGFDLLATSWLSAFANYSYQNFDQTFTGFSRRGMPHNKFNVGLRAEWENGLNGEAIFHYVGAATYPLGAAFSTFTPTTAPSEQVGSYNLLNMRAGYRFWQQKAAAGYMRDAEVAVSVFNALNDQHKEHPLGDIISRRVMGWLTVKF
jgi:iron complex outermembrane receptor protein